MAKDEKKKVKVSDVAVADDDEVTDAEELEEVEETEEDEKPKAKKAKKAKKVKKVKKIKAAKKAKKEKKATKEKKPSKPKMEKTTPYRPGCMYDEIFKMCQKGTTLDKITDRVKELGCNPRQTIREMRRGEVWGKKWDVEEKNGKIKIVYEA